MRIVMQQYVTSNVHWSESEPQKVRLTGLGRLCVVRGYAQIILGQHKWKKMTLEEDLTDKQWIGRINECERIFLFPELR